MMAGMANTGKVERVVRETVAVLVEELGPEGAAHMLEEMAARVRGAGHRPGETTAHQARPVTDRLKTAANS